MTYRFAGFRDAHAHPLFAGRELLGPVVTGCESIAEIQQVLREFRAAHLDLKWIDCGSYNRSLATDGRFLASWLDEAVADIPVVVHADDHHTSWVNTAALRVAGLLEGLPELAAGSIDVDETGQASGVLREWEAMNLVYVHQPTLTLAEELDALEAAQRTLLSFGVIGVQDAWIDPGMEAIYLAAEQANRLLVRTNLAPRINPSSWQVDLAFAIEVRDRVEEATSELLSCRTVKLFVDGVLGSATAALLEPYEASDSLGEPLWSTPDLERVAIEADSLGFQLHLHAIGDAGVRQAIDVIAKVIDANGPRDRRPIIAHLELISDEDIPRLAALGITVCLQPLWGRPDDMFHSSVPHIGEERANRLYRTRELLAAGASVAFGSDWPVSSPNALEGVYVATERALRGENQRLGPEQRIELQSALDCYTAKSAQASFQEQYLGTDWVELTADPAETPKELWADIRAERAFVAGRLIELD